MRLSHPTRPLHDFSRQEVWPAPGRNVVLDEPIVAEHGRDEERRAEHILTIETGARRVVGKLEHHRTQHRRALLACFPRGAPQVRHQATLELGKETQHVYRFLVE